MPISRKKFLYLPLIILIILTTHSFANDIKKIGKFKDWEVMVITDSSGKVCFAQSIPVLQAPKKSARNVKFPSIPFLQNI